MQFCEPLPHGQAGEVGAGEPGPLTVEELLERGVQADTHDDRGLAAVREQQRDVLGRRTGLARQGPDAEALDALLGSSA